MKKLLRLVFIGIVFAVMLVGFAHVAQAAPNVQWATDSVYYDSGKLIVEGYFFNNGTRTITWINQHNIRVYFRLRGSDWWLQADTTFKNLEVYIKPGEISRWTLRITNVPYAIFDHWMVDWQTDYQYI